MSEVHDRLMDAPDKEYRLGGLFLGTIWVNDDGELYEVLNVRRQTSEEQGHTFEFPELVVKRDDGKYRFRVQSFESKITTNADWGLEPSNRMAENMYWVIVE